VDAREAGRRARGARQLVVAVAAALLLAACASGGRRAASQRSSARDRHGVEVLGARESRPAPPAAAPSTAAPTTTTTTVTRVPSPVVATSCADALAYLATHQAPGFTDLCADGSALGHLGVTCVNEPGMCPGRRVVHIACPAPFVYMNEAHNSWVLTGERSGVDPYGQGSDAERAACAPHR
jgi:hypothetical protein